MQKLIFVHIKFLIDLMLVTLVNYLFLMANINDECFFFEKSRFTLFAILELVYYTDSQFNCFYNLLPIKFTIAIFALLMQALIFLTKSDF